MLEKRVMLLFHDFPIGSFFHGLGSNKDKSPYSNIRSFQTTEFIIQLIIQYTDSSFYVKTFF